MRSITLRNLDLSSFPDLRKQIAEGSYLAVDTETDSIDSHSATLRLASYWRAGKGDAVEPGHRLANLLRSDTPKVFWNAKYDLRVLTNAGFQVSGPILDAMVAARVLDPLRRDYKLKSWAKRVLQESCASEAVLKKLLRKCKSWGKIPLEVLVPYAIDDARYTWDLAFIIFGQLSDRDWEVFCRENALLEPVIAMEDRGVLLDVTTLEHLKYKATDTREKIEAAFRKLAGDNFSPKNNGHIRKLLFDQLKLPAVYYTATGKASVDRISLRAMNHKVPDAILKWRTLHKTGSTYLQNLGALRGPDNRIHPSFNTTGALTGRFSSSKPNFQNIPRAETKGMLGKMRSVFVAEKGYKFLFIDYDQIELRLAAHFSGDEKMVSSINAGLDLHAVTTSNIFGIEEMDPEWKVKRHIGKTLNFAMLYGAGPSRIMDALRQVGIKLSMSETSIIIEKYNATYPGIRDLFRRVDKAARFHGFLRNPYGRRLPIPPRESYKGVNYLIQGTAADLLKVKLIAVAKLLRNTTSHLIAAIHDELVFEISRADRKIGPSILTCMEDRTSFKVPITCTPSSGLRWSQKKEIKR